MRYNRDFVHQIIVDHLIEQKTTIYTCDTLRKTDEYLALLKDEEVTQASLDRLKLKIQNNF